MVDNLFIMGALISHSLYVNQPLFLTFYDIEKCFDSLWLEDCINSLWENGVQNDNLCLIYLLNKKASITVKTPLGSGSPFVIKNLVKQGTVLGPILNNCSLDRICKEGNGYQFGQVNIKPLEFVDDLADSNHSSMSAHVSNSVIEQIQFEKRLKFSAKKCELLAIGSDDAGYTLDINGRTIKHVSTVKYLGDILNAQGSNVDMIKSRVDRCHGSVTELISICKEAHFGQQQIGMMFLLYKAVFLPRMIYNCESWSKMTSKDIAELQRGQLHYLRSITEVPKSTPIAAVYLEFGVLPIQYEVQLRKLYFLKSILQKSRDDPVRMVYNEMLKYPCENNWANEVMGLHIRYGLSTDDWYVETTGINEWKHAVKHAVRNYAFQLLKSQCKENKKTKNLCFEKYFQSKYLTSLPPLLARLVFTARLRMYDVKNNFKVKYRFDLNCPFCRKEAETLQHTLQCDCVLFVKHKTGISVNVLLQQRHNTEALKKWGKFLKFYDIMRKALR